MNPWSRKLIVLLAAVALWDSGGFAADTRTSLAGKWEFALDARNEGVQQGWFRQDLADQIQLPGTTEEHQKGVRNSARETDKLTRAYPYAGAAWYQKRIEVPKEWAGKRIVLFLERTKPSRLWVDSDARGEQNSLVAPHIYQLGSLAPGPHRLSLCINNAGYAPIGDPHQISNHTQTNWNGIIGRIELRVSDSVWLEDVQVYPRFAEHAVRIRIEVGNSSGIPAAGTLTLKIPGISRGEPRLPASSVPFSCNGERVIVETEFILGAAARTWDEFSPALQRLSVDLSTSTGSQRDDQEISFGLREFKVRGTQFRINDKTVFLRGRVDNCVFPLTGHPPMDVEGWLRIFRIAKSYGLNHFRFHTWCPPDSAFEAADRLGIYLQPELPNWAAFGEPRHDDFLRAEGERILRFFGNHPSFVMLSLGNELGGKQQLMAPFVKHFRDIDGRHLYAQGTNNWFPGPGEGDDYFASFQVAGKRVRGSYATVDPPLGHVQIGPPSTLRDYSAAIAGLSIPVVSHEIGEYQSAPDFREIAEYKGVLQAHNLEAFRDRLKSAGMMDQADEFHRASGALAVLCYREEVEAALRTRGFGGFQLLDLQDFPGQGTALVGILNAFMESKGFILPARWREFCSETVPLVRMPKFAWTLGESFSGTAEIAHYGESDLANAIPAWTLSDTTGHPVASGQFPAIRIPQGSLTSVGDIRIPLRGLRVPGRFSLELSLRGTGYRNRYDFWVYPPAVDTNPGAVIVGRVFDQDLHARLASGARVLLMPELDKLPGNIGGSFAPDFWNFGMFRELAEARKFPVAPGTLGILCNPAHASMALFPSEFHSNWQWSHLLHNSRAIILDSMPAGFRPLIQVIDNLERSHKLGILFEARVNEGKIVVCSIDLPGQSEKPEARQLLHSLLRYMNSDQFAPVSAVEMSTLEHLFR